MQSDTAALSRCTSKSSSTISLASPSGEEVNHGLRPIYPRTETVVDLLVRHANDKPLSSALVVPEGEHTDGHRLTINYNEMHTIVVRAARNLLDTIAVAPCQLQDNDRSPSRKQDWPPPIELTGALDPNNTSNHWVIVVLPQGLAQVVAVWTVLFACKGYVPVDSETKLPRLRRLFAETKPVACIGEAQATPIAAAAAEFGVPLLTFAKGVRAGLCVSDVIPGIAAAAAATATVTATAATAAAAVTATATTTATATVPGTSLALRRPKPSELCVLFYSSGSTGTPKGIAYDHRWLTGGSW